MNHKITTPFVAVCCLTMGLTLIAQEGGEASSGEASSKVQQLEKEMRNAQMNSDASWYEQHLADDYVEGRSWGKWVNKSEAIKAMQDKSIKFNKAELSDLKVATFGPNTAVAHYTFTYDATLNGTHRARTIICSDTWISQSGEWKIASNHCSHVEGK